MGARVVGAEAVASLDRPLSVSTGPSSDMALETCAEAGGKAHKRKVRSESSQNRREALFFLCTGRKLHFVLLTRISLSYLSAQMEGCAPEPRTIPAVGF